MQAPYHNPLCDRRDDAAGPTGLEPAGDWSTTRCVGIAAACGGSVQNSNDPACGDPSLTCANGATCSQTVDECGAARTQQCNCVKSRWLCDHVECPKPDRCLPGGVRNGDFGDVKGAQCTPADIPKCGDAIPPCTCDGAKWICSAYQCPPCPDPWTVKQGESCTNAGLYAHCPGHSACNMPLTCTCIGDVWQCNGGVCANDGGPIDAGGD